MANISIYDPRTMGKLVERMPKVQTFIKSTSVSYTHLTLPTIA